MPPLRGDRARVRTHKGKKQGEELGFRARPSWVPGGRTSSRRCTLLQTGVFSVLCLRCCVVSLQALLLSSGQ